MVHFSEFTDQYVLIGGSACDLVMEEAGLDFRATRDLDIVLCAEALSRTFVEAFWDFVEAAGYEIQEKATGEKQFYRFVKPQDDRYPVMLELFSRVPDVLDPEKVSLLAPVQVEDEAVSLSAILLDPDHYDWILRGKQLLNGVPIVGPEHIIPLKARAWLDLTARKEAGSAIDSRDIKKHKNDVFRLMAAITPRPISDVPESIREDLDRFLNGIVDDNIDFKALGLGRRDKEEVFAILRGKYGI